MALPPRPPRGRRAPGGRRAAAAALWARGWLAPAGGAEGPPAAPRPDFDRPIGWLGITIQEVGEEMAERLAARFGPAAGTGGGGGEPMPGGPGAAAGPPRGGGVGGVIITAGAPRSPARAAGLRPMDVVLEVDGRPVAGLKDLYAALRAAAGKPAFPFAVARAGGRPGLTLAPGSA